MSKAFSAVALTLVLSFLPQSVRGESPNASGSDGIFSLTGIEQVGKSEPCADAGCCATDCCTPCWRVFGEFLYLRPGNEKVAYAVPINGAIVPPAGAAPVQVGMEAVADVSFSPGFRLGATRAIDDCASFGLMYSQLDGDTFGSIDISSTPYVLRSLVNHPGAVSAPTDFLDAAARSQMGFKLADIDYRRMLAFGDNYGLNYLIGLRYANLHQSFNSAFSNSTTLESVGTASHFDGMGLRVGLEGERYAPCTGLTVYGKGYASFVGGVFSNHYVQADNFRGTVVDTGWNEDRVLSILELELGLGWTSCDGRVRLTGGYQVSAWMNTINTDDFIQAVRTNSSANSPNLSGVTTFDGFTCRLEYRF